MENNAEKYADNCPKCSGKDMVQFDEDIIVGMYCKECDVLVDEYGAIINLKEK